jgi:hypothetical protein
MSVLFSGQLFSQIKEIEVYINIDRGMDKNIELSDRDGQGGGRAIKTSSIYPRL